MLAGRRGFEMVEQVAGGGGDFGHRGLEGGGVGARRFAVAADLTDVLEGGFVELLIGKGELGSSELFDATAHGHLKVIGFVYPVV